MNIDKEFKSLIPPLSAEEYAGLEASILAEGCRDALIVWNDILIDGHNRYEICEKHGIEYKETRRDFKDRSDALAWVIRNQFARRNLTPYQRSELALKLEPLIREKAKERQGTRTDLCQNSDKSAPIDTKKEIAKAAGVSHDTIMKVKKIQEEAPEEVKEKTRSGELSINQAYNEIKQAEKQKEKDLRIEKDKDARGTAIAGIDIRRGDFKDVLADVNGIDAIITDPPYPAEFLDCFSDLSLYACDHLKDDGWLVVYSGQYNVPEVIKRLSEHMVYVWTFCLSHGGKTQLVNGVNIMCGWKPIFIFSKGKKKMRFSVYDVIESLQREKHSHEWQQSESGVLKLIEAFSEPGQLIVDPFSGAGTFCKVAIENGRRAIGAEIN